MAVQRMTELRRLALGQLAAYRQNAAAQRNGEAIGREARAWLRAIARVRAVLHDEDAEKERFMVRLWGLDHPIPQRRTARERLIKLTLEQNCSEATLYNWRAEIVELVILSAVEAGLIVPFQDGKSRRAPK